jgi:predicted metalloprotease with PDZ domain
MMDTGAVATIIVSQPRAHEGVGILGYEIRNNGLLVLEVEKHSPAGRAGIREGEYVVAIDGLRVASLDGSKAASLLSMAAERSYLLQVADITGAERQVTLDSGYIWLTM